MEAFFPSHKDENMVSHKWEKMIKTYEFGNDIAKGITFSEANCLAKGLTNWVTPCV